MKNRGSNHQLISVSAVRMLLALSLSTATMVGCGHDDNNDNTNNSAPIVALPNSNSCSQVLPNQGFDRYRGYGYRQYRMETMTNPTTGRTRDGRRVDGVHEEISVREHGSQRHASGTDYYGYQPGYQQPGYQQPGYGPGYGGYNGFTNGFNGCGAGYFPACDVGGGGLTCVPSQGVPMNSIAGFNYGQGNFAFNGWGLNTCGYGQNCFQQIAQTCVIGMPNGCAQGACYPVGNGVGVCAIQPGY